MDCAKQELKKILKKCQTKNVNVKQSAVVEKFLKAHTKPETNNEKWFKIIVTLCLLAYGLNYYFNDLSSKRCVLKIPQLLRYSFRPPENCGFCKHIDHIPRVRDISPQDFAELYAYSAAPVIVEDATKNWTALEKFNYWYFREIYFNAKRKQKILDCQFLPYKTGFQNLFEALDMPKERVEYFNASGKSHQQKPWYFGWSNCNPETAEKFRRHYGRPYFLPETSENNAVDWFFIGTAGLGAHMHIDNVRLPSWQAQLSGSKRWLLAPPPECYFQCQSFEVVVKKSDIIVLDTNKWYHQTFVQPGEISLTIGAEYD